MFGKIFFRSSGWKFTYPNLGTPRWGNLLSHDVSPLISSVVITADFRAVKCIRRVGSTLWGLITRLFFHGIVVMVLTRATLVRTNRLHCPEFSNGCIIRNEAWMTFFNQVPHSVRAWTGQTLPALSVGVIRRVMYFLLLQFIPFQFALFIILIFKKRPCKNAFRTFCGGKFLNCSIVLWFASKT